MTLSPSNNDRAFPFYNFKKENRNFQNVQLRSLSPDEIRELKQLGNHADNWELLRIAGNFSSAFIRNSIFSGEVVIMGIIDRKIEILPGFSHFPGIYNSVVNNSFIGSNSLVMNCSLILIWFSSESTFSARSTTS